MCLHVERAHVERLKATISFAFADLKANAPQTANNDFLLRLSPSVAVPSIVYRDFPKRHGNIIQEAVGIALASHRGGYSAVSKRFHFLSGLQVSIDNFFLSSSGQIFLIETKRNHENIREQGTAARILKDVSEKIQVDVYRRTKRRLQHKIECAYFSYASERFVVPKVVDVNIASPSAPVFFPMPVYSRQDLNALIGPCFGQFLTLVDDLVGRIAHDICPEITLNPDRAVSENMLLTKDDTAELLLLGGEPTGPGPTEDDILSPQATQSDLFS